MDDDNAYIATRASFFPAGRTRVVALLRDSCRAVELDDLELRVLRSCVGLKSLQAHLHVCTGAGLNAEPSALWHILESLVERGLLCARSSTRSEVRQSPAVATEHVAVVTKDRAEFAHRCLASLERHRDRDGHVARVIVIDGSELAAASAATATAAHDLAARYVGSEAAGRLRKRLSAATGVTPDILDFGLTPGSIGSNRSLALLLTAGNRIVMVDDDVDCTLWTTAARRDDVQLGDHADAREWHFFPSRHAALASVHRAAGNLFDVHDALLGQSLPALATTDVDASCACAHLLDLMGNDDGTAGARIRSTFSGLAGDAAIYCPHRLLGRTGRVHDELASSDDALRLALTSREVTCIADRYLVVHETSWASYCMGLCNDALLPPFVPLGRNEDGLFGAMLARIDPSSLCGHVPYGILHDSPRPSGYGDRDMPSATETRLTEFLVDVVRSLEPSLEIAPDARLRHIAAHLADLASLPFRDFRFMVGNVALNARSRYLMHLRAMLAGTESYSATWHTAVDNYEHTLRASFSRPDFLLPIEFHRHATMDDGFMAMQRFLGRFAAFIDVWPALWDAARQLEDPLESA
jgi:hypothetical protein